MSLLNYFRKEKEILVSSVLEIEREREVVVRRKEGMERSEEMKERVYLF